MDEEGKMEERTMMVQARFRLHETICEELKSRPADFGFGGFGEATYYRTYSRIKGDGTQEQWADTVIRVINGVISVRQHHYLQNRLEWNDSRWQAYAEKIAIAMFEMKWLPPGRGLWAMGTEYVYERGGAALNNCGAVDTAVLSDAADWAMDMLMCGVGVGFNTAWEGEGAVMPDKSRPLPFVIPDSREGWVASVRMLIESYTRGGPWHVFDYTLVRPAGSPIRGFGGTASGPEPLIELHGRLERFLDAYCSGQTDATRCCADVFNAIGACVVAGNVRRSAEIALGSIDDETFLDLKNYDKYPERSDIGWISNNSVILKSEDEFAGLPEIAGRILKNGEPGIINLVNVRKYGRYGDASEDSAWLANPCSEIPLESCELCNLAEVFPSRCKDEEEFCSMLEYATFYASTVALLPTHRSESNAVMERNRRIGVSLSGIVEMLDAIGEAELTGWLRRGYEVVRRVNRRLAAAAGVPPSIRITTIKPSGTISQLAGVVSGMRFPDSRYAIRRMRVGNGAPICRFFKAAGVPSEPDVYSENTTVFEFPIEQGKGFRSAASARGQFAVLAMLQREWSDNMVSCTVTLDPECDEHRLIELLNEFVPLIKSVSLLPCTKKGAYRQMPYEEITEEEYERRAKAMPVIDWAHFGGSDGRESTYCTDEECNG